MIRCLHGNVGSHHDWDLFKGHLGHELPAPDLWSLLESGPLSLPEAGAKIAETADHGEVLLGYSLGGRLALHALLARPEKWRAAVIVSTHPGLAGGHGTRLAADARWADLVRRDWEEFIEQWNALEILGAGQGLPPGFRQAARARQSEVARAFDCWSLGTQENLVPSFSRLDLPLLWITGELDNKFTAIAREAVPDLPNARHLVIPDAGHRVPWEQPGIFSKAVRDFVSSVDRTG